VVVTHDLISAMNIASRILMLHEGRVVEYSTPEDFIYSKVEVVQQFLQAQHVPMGFGSGDDQDEKK
jgi:phospholipid/cholesterol/gamma-HCH transport system ATP-binding protein